ncbi:MAG: PPC domain-containing protein [Sandaracinaceae bacterium]
MTRSQLLLAVSVVALGACAAEDPVDFDPTAEPEVGSAVSQAKADGAFGAQDINLGDSFDGETAGNAVALYAFFASSGDQIQIQVTRASGDLRPSAYLYEGVETSVRPTDYDASSSQVELNYTLSATGTYYIAVKAYRGEGAGEFEAVLSCTGGPCAGGSSLTGLARADQCLTRAADCALRELPSYDGRVGATTAENLLNSCLAEAGSDCVDACDAHEHLRQACDVIVGELPTLADTNRGCLVGLSYCLDICNEVSPFGYGDEDYLITPTCWAGHQGDVSSATGHCLEYAADLTDCGGSEYEGDTLIGCEALCAATDGAWDEGPWDGCLDECADH